GRPSIKILCLKERFLLGASGAGLCAEWTLGSDGIVNTQGGSPRNRLACVSIAVANATGRAAGHMGGTWLRGGYARDFELTLWGAPTFRQIHWQLLCLVAALTAGRRVLQTVAAAPGRCGHARTCREPGTRHLGRLLFLHSLRRRFAA